MTTSEIEQKIKKPKCVGMIMDGNRRWAKERGLPTFEGHRIGLNKVKEVAEWCIKEEIPHIVLFALSIDNWNRAKEEVSYLMSLIKYLIGEELMGLKKKGIEISFIGDMSLAPEDIRTLIQKVEKEKVPNPKLHLTLCFSYGGRREILNAMKEIIQTKNKEEIANFTEEDFSRFLWTSKADMPDPDIIIRTSGEMRLSGFLPWQGVYSELFFTKTYWPDFSYEEFMKILEEFSSRERRLGK